MAGLRVFFRENKMNTILTLGFSILGALVMLLISEKVKYFFNYGVNNNNLEIVQAAVLIIITFYLVNIIINVSYTVFAHRLQYVGQLRLQINMIEKLLKTNYEDLASINPGAAWQEIFITSDKLADFYISFIFITFGIIKVLIFGSIVFTASQFAGWVSIGSIPIVISFTLFMKKYYEYAERKILFFGKEMSGRGIESLDMIKTVKTKGAKEYFLKKIIESNKKNNFYSVLREVSMKYVEHFLTLMAGIVPISVVWLIMKYGAMISISTGDLVIIYTFTPLFVKNINDIYKFFMRQFGVKPYLECFNRYIMLPEERTGVQKELTGYTIETQNVFCDFGKKQVRVPDLTVRPGEKVLICGESGIGKSSLFNILVGLNSSYQGKVTIGGIDLKDLDLKVLRERVGLCLQDHKIFEGTINDNIRVGKNVDSNHLEDLIQITNLSEVSRVTNGAKVSNPKLSGGEKSRIQLAQTLVGRPKILLIDEALSSVDEDMERTILENVLKYYQDITILMVTHRKSAAEKYFDRVIEYKFTDCHEEEVILAN